MLRDADAVSDFEDDNADLAPRRVDATWRSGAMEMIIRCLDRVAMDRARTAQKKMSVKGLLLRRDHHMPDELDVVPSRFPIDAYSADWNSPICVR